MPRRIADTPRAERRTELARTVASSRRASVIIACALAVNASASAGNSVDSAFANRPRMVTNFGLGTASTSTRSTSTRSVEPGGGINVGSLGRFRSSCSTALTAGKPAPSTPAASHRASHPSRSGSWSHCATRRSVWRRHESCTASPTRSWCAASATIAIPTTDAATVPRRTADVAHELVGLPTVRPQPVTQRQPEHLLELPAGVRHGIVGLAALGSADGLRSARGPRRIRPWSGPLW